MVDDQYLVGVINNKWISMMIGKSSQQNTSMEVVNTGQLWLTLHINYCLVLTGVIGKEWQQQELGQQSMVAIGALSQQQLAKVNNG